MREPFELLPGGYAMCRNLSTGGGWTLITAANAPAVYSARPRVGSRRERRKTEFPNWQNSGVATEKNFATADLVRPRL
jgi:hypothetical protein